MRKKIIIMGRLPLIATLTSRLTQPVERAFVNFGIFFFPFFLFALYRFGKRGDGGEANRATLPRVKNANKKVFCKIHLSVNCAWSSTKKKKKMMVLREGSILTGR